MESWPVTIALPLGLTIGGMTSWAVRLASALASSGRRVRLVVHPPVQGHAACEALDRSIDPAVERVAAPELRAAGGVAASARVYRDLLPALLLPGIWAESDAVVAALSSVHADALRVLGWVHSDNPYDYARAAYYEPIIARYVVNSTRCRDELACRVPARSRDIELIPHGVPIPADRPRPPLSGRPLRLAYLGRMEQLVKRVLHLPALARRLDGLGMRFEMRLVGDGPQTRELDAAIAAANAAFTTPGNHMRREAPVDPASAAALWTWADVSLLVSEHEGLSMGMLEAMAAGCCPLVTRVASGAGDAIRDGENGLLAPVDDEDALARRLAEAAADAGRIAALGRAARQTVERDYAFDRYVGRVVAALDALAATDPRPWPPDRAVLMGAATATQAAGTVPGDAAARMERLLRRLASEGVSSVALFSAGAHTMALARVLADSPVAIAGFLDDDPGRCGRRLWGWPVVAPRDAASLGADCVVISSWMHEKSIWARRQALESAGLRVLRLYADAACDEPSARDRSAAPGGRRDERAALCRAEV